MRGKGAERKENPGPESVLVKGHVNTAWQEKREVTEREGGQGLHIVR